MSTLFPGAFVATGVGTNATRAAFIDNYLTPRLLGFRQIQINDEQPVRILTDGQTFKLNFENILSAAPLDLVLSGVPQSYATATETATTLAVNASLQITDSASGFVTAGFTSAQNVLISGFTNSTNNGYFKLSSVSAGTMSLASVVSRSGTTFAVNASLQITDSASGFLTAGLTAGQKITVTGFTTGGNNNTFTIQTVTANTITVTSTTGMAAEPNASQSVLIKAIMVVEPNTSQTVTITAIPKVNVNYTNGSFTFNPVPPATVSPVQFGADGRPLDVISANYWFDYFPVPVLEGLMDNAINAINTAAKGAVTYYTIEDAPIPWYGVISDMTFVLALERVLTDYSLWRYKLLFAIGPEQVESGSDNVASQLQTMKDRVEERVNRTLDNEKFKCGEIVAGPTRFYYDAVRGVTISGAHGQPFVGGPLNGFIPNRIF